MSKQIDLDRMVAALLAETAAPHEPAGLLDSVLSTTGRSRPRPRWLAFLKEPPMRTNSRLAVGSPTFRLATIMALTIALILAAAAAVVAGASMLPSPAPQLPDPFGPAANGNIVYSSGGDIYAADATGDHALPIVIGPDNDVDPRFSHDGTRFIFLREAADKTTWLMVARSDGTVPMPLTGPLAVLDWYDWSPDDRQVVAHHEVHGHPSISIVPADGSLGMDTLDTGTVEPMSWVEWRPTDGRELLFQGYPPSASDAVAIYSIKADGAPPRMIAPAVTPNPAGSAAYADLVVSPDGATIAYWRWGPNEAGQTDGWEHLLNIDTGTERILTSMGGTRPAFSPDSTLIVGEGRHQLVVEATDGTTPATNLGPSYTADSLGYSFSPDGKTVVQTLGDPGVTSLIDVATGQSSVTRSAIPGVPTWQRLAPSQP